MWFFYCLACNSQDSQDAVRNDTADESIRKAPLAFGPRVICEETIENPTHTDKAQELGIRRESGRLEPLNEYGGAGLIDWDTDGDLDLIYGFTNEDLILYLQQEELEQQILPIRAGALHWGKAWNEPMLMVSSFWIYLLFPAEQDTPYFLWFEEFDGVFSDVQLFDWNMDGQLDLYAGARASEVLNHNQNRLFINNGHRLLWGDHISDHQETQDVVLWKNSQDQYSLLSLSETGGLLIGKDRTQSVSIQGSGAVVGSLNNDSLADLIVFGSDGASVYLNDLEYDELHNIYAQAPVRGASFIDVDNDGVEEILLAPGQNDILGAELRPILLRYVQDSWTVEPLDVSIGSWHSIVADDWNQDGVLDALITNATSIPVLWLSQSCSSNHWLKVNVPIGSTVTVTTSSHTLTRWASNESGVAATKESFVWFGLGATEEVQKVEIELVDGTRYEYGSFLADRVVDLEF